jgi:hypothetical protein
MPLFLILSVPIPVFCSYVYTLLGGVRSEADVARFSCTNKEQIFERSCKDIDTVRNVNIVARSDLLRTLGCTEMYDVLENSTSDRFTSYLGGNTISGCMNASMNMIYVNVQMNGIYAVYYKIQLLKVFTLLLFATYYHRRTK